MIIELTRRWRGLADKRRLARLDERLRADIGLAGRDRDLTTPTHPQRMGRYTVYRIHSG